MDDTLISGLADLNYQVAIMNNFVKPGSRNARLNGINNYVTNWSDSNNIRTKFLMVAILIRISK